MCGADMAHATQRQGAPLENFHPDPPQKAKAASPTDCRDNKPQTFNASFMVAPPLPPVQPCKVLVNLMTTFIDNADPTKTVAQDNMLRAFKRLRAHGIRSWLFTENEKWAKKARDNGVCCPPQRVCRGLRGPDAAYPGRGRGAFPQEQRQYAVVRLLLRMCAAVRDAWR